MLNIKTGPLWILVLFAENQKKTVEKLVYQRDERLFSVNLTGQSSFQGVPKSSSSYAGMFWIWIQRLPEGLDA